MPATIVDYFNNPRRVRISMTWILCLIYSGCDKSPDREVKELTHSHKTSFDKPGTWTQV